MHEPLTAVKQK